MVKIQVNAQGKAYLTGAGKVLIANEGLANTVTATNTTGAAVSKDDKVWLEKSGANYNIVNFDSTSRNFNVTGSPTINDTTGVVSGFNTSNYLTLPRSFNPSNHTWEINLKIHLTDVSTFQFIYNGNVAYYGVSIEVSPAGVFQVELSGSTSSFSIGQITGTTPLVANTDYWLKLIFTGTEYKLKISTDGVSFTDDGNTITSSTLITPSAGVFGLQYVLANPLLGSIDMKESYFIVNGEYYWRGYEVNVSDSAVTGVAKENIANNASGSVKTVLPEE